MLHTLAEARKSGVPDVLTAGDKTKAEIMGNLATLVLRLTLPGDEACLVGPLLRQPALVTPLLEAVLRSLAAPQQQQQQGAAHPTTWPAAAAAYHPNPMTWHFTDKLLWMMQRLARIDQQQQTAAAFAGLPAEQRCAVLQQLQSLGLSVTKVLASSSSQHAPELCALSTGATLAPCLMLPSRVQLAANGSRAAGSSQAAGLP